MNPLDILISYFNSVEWPLDLNEKKLKDRATVVSESDLIKLVKIERHRPVLNDSYTVGLPMDAFQTYWMVYAVNIKTRKVEELEEQLGKIEVNIPNLVSKELYFENFWLNIELIEDSDTKYTISETVTNNSVTISSLDDAYNFGISLCSPIIEYFEFNLI